VKIEQWPIEKLIPYACNPRKNDSAVNKMAQAIQTFGFRVPVLARSSGEVIDGHLRIKAAAAAGFKEVPVLFCDDMTDAQIKLFRISVNRMADLAEWDMDLLKIEMLELKELDFDLELTGFDLDSLDGIFADVIEETSTDRDGQGVSSTWGQVKKGENTRVVLGKLETRLPLKIVERLIALLNQEYDLHGTPINVSLQKFMEASLAHSGH